MKIGQAQFMEHPCNAPRGVFAHNDEGMNYFCSYRRYPRDKMTTENQLFAYAQNSLYWVSNVYRVCWDMRDWWCSCLPKPYEYVWDFDIFNAELLRLLDQVVQYAYCHACVVSHRLDDWRDAALDQLNLCYDELYMPRPIEYDHESHGAIILRRPAGYKVWPVAWVQQVVDWTYGRERYVVHEELGPVPMGVMNEFEARSYGEAYVCRNTWPEDFEGKIRDATELPINYVRVMNVYTDEEWGSVHGTPEDLMADVNLLQYHDPLQQTETNVVTRVYAKQVDIVQKARGMEVGVNPFESDPKDSPDEDVKDEDDVAPVRELHLNNDAPLKKPLQAIVKAFVGGVPVRVLLDTGAALSMIRTSVAEQLRKCPRTNDSIGESLAVGVPMNCEGAEKGKVIGRITRKTQMKLVFVEPAALRGHRPQVGNISYADRGDRRPVGVREETATFCELDKLADGIIVGCPELAAWGFFLVPDLDQSGLGYVQFTNLGITLPLVGTRAESRVNVIHPVLLAGPDYVTIKVEALRQDAEYMVQ